MTGEPAALAGMFVSALLTATVLPGSAEVVLAALIATEAADPGLLVLAGTGGNTAGGLVNWALGRTLLHLLDRRWFPSNRAYYLRARAWFERYGVWSLLLAWLPLIGDALTVAAGALRVGPGRFTLLVATGNAARYVALAAGLVWLRQLAVS